MSGYDTAMTVPSPARRIVDAAREVIAANGIPGVSMDQVAKQAHVSRSTLYRIFPNRDQLIARVVAIEIRTLRRKLALGTPSSTPRSIPHRRPHGRGHPHRERHRHRPGPHAPLLPPAEGRRREPRPPPRDQHPHALRPSHLVRRQGHQPHPCQPRVGEVQRRVAEHLHRVGVQDAPTLARDLRRFVRGRYPQPGARQPAGPGTDGAQRSGSREDSARSG